MPEKRLGVGWKDLLMKSVGDRELEIEGARERERERGRCNRKKEKE